MGNKITGKEYPLSKIFSKEFDFHIPVYQRPYAWSEEETGTLFNDLYDFYSTEKDDNYFLGSIVLIKKDDIPKADVIDGQQRLTTLTILIAVISSYLTGKIRTDCNNYLCEPGNELEGLTPLPRLHLREKDQDFFNKYIQNVNLDDLINLDSESLKNESQRHIKLNCELLIRKMDETFCKDEKAIKEFCTFLITRCFLVAVYTQSQNSAFRVFSVMNSRGLNLLPIDIIKSDIIGKISSSQQQKYTDKWEELEIQTTRSGFNDVFTHTRMIYAKSKAKKSLLDEFNEYVVTKVNPTELIDDILEPYSEAYTILVNKKYVAERNAEEVNKYLFWLNKIDNSDWMPSAIRFMAEYKSDANYILWFIRKLERLAAYLHITGKDINRRIDRYKRLLEEMEENTEHCLENPLSSIELSNEEKREFMMALDGEIYKLTGKRRNYVILRLNDFVSDGATRYDFEPNVLTIEHVLPQEVIQGSRWEKWWPKVDERQIWLNRIANLVPLTRKKNSSASNFEFDRKKEIYFKGKNGTTSYPLTTQVLTEKEWTPSVIKKRQENLLDVFKENWELNYKTNNIKDNDTSVEHSNEKLFYICNDNIDATGFESENGFIVEKGSKISDDIVDNFKNNYPDAYVLRNQLCLDSTIVDGVFQKNYEFDNPSIAAQLICGKNVLGRKKWLDYEGNMYDSREFNINDDSTYELLTVGQLAFELFNDIFNRNVISEIEVEKLKTVEYTKQLFSEVSFPVLSTTREAYKYNKSIVKYRYRIKPIIYKEKHLYFTTQWFESNRREVIEWYKKHLEKSN